MPLLCDYLTGFFVHIPVTMFSKTLFVSIPLLWRCTTALPAGPGSWPNGTSFVHSSSDVHTSAVYNLLDTYDASNWLSKFNVEDISDPTRTFLDHRLIQINANKV
jgi:hypothetical protein